MGDTMVPNCQDGEVRHETAGYISSELRDALEMPFVAPFEARIAAFHARGVSNLPSIMHRFHLLPVCINYS